ncbi:MAG: carbohydrate ABC transporter permease [Oscillospiraceae bacterium]|nr:carbohydrate ABC transporter permease [Oscillospiraceae bacterium]
MIKTTGTKIGDWVIVFVCLILIVICLLPVVNILARSLSHPRPLTRSEVMLLPIDSVVEYKYETVLDTSNNPVKETAIITHSADIRTYRALTETLIIREGFDDRTGEPIMEAIPINYLFDSGDFDRLEVDEATGTQRESLFVGEISYVNDYDEQTGLGTFIIKDADVLYQDVYGNTANLLDNQGMPVTATAVIRHTSDGGFIETSTYIIRDSGRINPSTGLPQMESVPMSQVFAGVTRAELDTLTGEPLEYLTLDEVSFVNDYDPATGLGTLILENTEVRRASTINVSKVGVDLTAYSEIFKDDRYTWSLAWTAMLTVACAIWSVFMTAICAYPLTYDHLKGRKFFNTVIILTMYFGAGTVPTYLLLKNLGLINHPLVLALPFCLSVFNMIIMRSYFYGIPLSLRESAELDGAGPIRTMVSIYIPLSMPVVATLLLFYAVGRWNGYSDAMMFMSQNERYFPIQYLLYNMLQGRTSVDVELSVAERQVGASESIQTAMVMFAMVPILVVYPFLQRYFIAGVTLGAVKE